MLLVKLEKKYSENNIIKNIKRSVKTVHEEENICCSSRGG